MAIRVREMTSEEVEVVQRLARSRTESARLVERAKMVWLSRQGRRVGQIAAELNLCHETVRTWLRRFNADGMAGLQDAPRPGIPPKYTAAQVGEVLAAALTHPQELGLPFNCWTLDRLETYLNEVKGITLKRSRIDELLLAEGLRWRKHETWFSARVDPDFAEKRGRSRSCTVLRRRAV
jgi:transposase